MPKSLTEHLAEIRRRIPTREREPSTHEQATAPIQGPDLSKYRPLTPEEKAFLTYLLQHAEPDATAFLPQLEGMRAQPSCTCGCPSIALAVAPGRGRVGYPRRIIGDYTGGDPPDDLVGVLLWQAGGQLAELEVFAYFDIKEPFGFPSVSTLELVTE